MGGEKDGCGTKARSDCGKLFMWRFFFILLRSSRAVTFGVTAKQRLTSQLAFGPALFFLGGSSVPIPGLLMVSSLVGLPGANRFFIYKLATENPPIFEKRPSNVRLVSTQHYYQISTTNTHRDLDSLLSLSLLCKDDRATISSSFFVSAGYITYTYFNSVTILSLLTRCNMSST